VLLDAGARGGSLGQPGGEPDVLRGHQVVSRACRWRRDPAPAGVTAGEPRLLRPDPPPPRCPPRARPPSSDATLLPAGEGRPAVVTMCSSCHGLATSVAQHHTRPE